MHWLNVILERIWSKLSNTLFHIFTLSFVLFSSKHWLTVIVIVEEFLKTQENTYHILLNETKIFSWCHDAFMMPWVTPHLCLYRFSGYKIFSQDIFTIWNAFECILPFEMVKIPFQSPNFLSLCLLYLKQMIYYYLVKYTNQNYLRSALQLRRFVQWVQNNFFFSCHRLGSFTT